MENLELKDLKHNEVYVTIKHNSSHSNKGAIFKYDKNSKFCTDSFSYCIDLTSIKFDKANTAGFYGSTSRDVLREATLEEKQWLEACIKADEFIPKQEVNNQNLNGRYLKALVDRPQFTKIKKDDYVKILNSTYASVKFEDECGASINVPNSTFGKLWELMPEGFEPDNQYIDGNWYIVTNGGNKDCVIKYKFTDKDKNISFYEGFKDKIYCWDAENADWIFVKCNLKLFDISKYLNLFPKDHSLYSEKTPKYEVGKWYKMNNCWYAKFLTIHGSGRYWRFSEEISSTSHYYPNPSNCSNWESITIELLTDLSEIQQYLPDGHPDKVIKILYIDELLAKAKRDYPIGTKILSACANSNYKTTVYGIKYIDKNNIHCTGERGESSCHIYNNGKWAEIIEESVKHNFKIGDKVNIPRSKQDYSWCKNNQKELDNYNLDYFIIKNIYHNHHVILKRADGGYLNYDCFYESDLSLYQEFKTHNVKNLEVTYGLTIFKKQSEELFSKVLEHQSPIILKSNSKKLKLIIIN